MRFRTAVAIFLLVGVAFATRPWTEEEFRAFDRSYRPQFLPRPESLVFGPRRFNYLERVKLACDFVARYQVSDSMSPDFGGIIEAEHMPTVIETDNTQEAIWIWSRWFELTGRNDYSTQIRRAWVYVLRHPAYREHGGVPGSIWYSVWNCGLAFMAESQYRRAFGDSSFLAYADTCRNFYLANPLLSTTALDYFVTSQSSGMAYAYARERNDPILHDTALARGQRVKRWVEANARGSLGLQSWAMCGGTAFWGIAHTVCQEDTAAGRVWLSTYVDSLPGFYPAGSWNCSHNIWLANAYRSAAELTSATPDWLMHQYLVDTLLMKDTDRDGGIPATWTDPNTQDQTWVTTYLDFMGMDVFVTPTFDQDVSVLEFTAPERHGVYVVGDMVQASVPVANAGRDTMHDLNLIVEAGGSGVGVRIDSLPFLAIETIPFPPIPLDTPGMYTLLAYSSGDNNPLNDTVRLTLDVHGLYRISGTIVDSASAQGIPAWVLVSIAGDSTVWDSCLTNRSGGFSLQMIDTTVTLSIKTWLPYYNRAWTFVVHGDTEVNLVTTPADLALINCDSAARYERFYTGPLDSLGVHYSSWSRSDSARIPYDQFDRLLKRTAIWYSGNTRTGTVPAEDQAGLAAFLGRGGNLFLTGQNIAEELAGTSFLETTIGCRFDSSGFSGFFAFGDRADSLGRAITGIATAGGNGANNQNSRDIIIPTAARSFIVYDSTIPLCAGVRRADASGGKVIFLGFGFEAVNRPQARPTYFTRTQLMALVLNWFGINVGVADRELQNVGRSRHATIVRGVLHLGPGHNPIPFGESGLCPRPLLLDATGRTVMRLQPGANDVLHLAPGVYFVAGASELAKVVIQR
ncbi:MAG: hypothetical protein ABIK86_08025 [candidate division WOR-3 bacterium]